MMSKQDYLKKYLSGGGKDKKKRRKVKKKKTVVLDDDGDWKKAVQSSDKKESDMPIIVGESIPFVHTPCSMVSRMHNRCTVYINVYVQLNQNLRSLGNISGYFWLLYPTTYKCIIIPPLCTK